MNLQQLNYIVAVDEHRHFQKAADACHITPATLSMMIKKLEQELDTIIFDRSKQPVVPTDIGTVVIEKAKVILHSVDDLQQSIKDASKEISGILRIGIIPTLAPYLSHLFLPNILRKYPNVRIKLQEWNTEQIVEALIHGRLDVGIAATPLNLPEIKERHLFYEELLAYSSQDFTQESKEYILPEDIDLSKLWLLEEEHCLRSQVSRLCSLKKSYQDHHMQLEFNAGSIETLLKMVSVNDGITIIPELVVDSLNQKQKKGVKHFKSPVPVREISLITYRHFVKDKLLKVIQEEILMAVKPKLKNQVLDKKVIDI
jgi:LysR family hydrogen peroxide-inducible transcriptional activator